VFEVTRAEPSQVVKGPDTTKLEYKLTNIQLKYEMIRSQMLADEACSEYSSGKEIVFDHVHLEKTIPFKRDTDTRLNIKVNAKKAVNESHPPFCSWSRIRRARGIWKNMSSPS